jgi:ribosomal-protein-alanine N-acetyltransferase
LLPLTRLHAEVAAEIHRRSFSDGWTAESIGGLLAMPGTEGIIALLHGVPSGMILFRTAADEAEILTLAVMPAARRCGIGSSLVGAALEHAADRGARAVFLEVAEDNTPAQALYRGAGFAAIGRRPNYYNNPPGSADAQIYQLKLSSRDRTASTPPSE